MWGLEPLLENAIEGGAKPLKKFAKDHFLVVQIIETQELT